MLVCSLAACAPAWAQNLVVNGGFEQPVISQAWVQRVPGELFGSWTVDSVNQGIVHVAGFGNPFAFEGAQCLELNFFQSCGVSQSVPTVLGRRYAISFAMAGQTNAGPDVKRMRVDWAGAALAEVAWSRSGTGGAWVPHALITPVAEGTSAVVHFYGLEEVDGGPYLDDVRVVEFCVADFNDDGSVDFFDYLDFVAAFSTGC